MAENNSACSCMSKVLMSFPNKQHDGKKEACSDTSKKEETQSLSVVNLFNVCLVWSQKVAWAVQRKENANFFLSSQEKEENLLLWRSATTKRKAKVFLSAKGIKEGGGEVEVGKSHFADGCTEETFLLHTLPPKYPATKSQYTTFITALGAINAQRWSEKLFSFLNRFLSDKFHVKKASTLRVGNRRQLNHRQFAIKLTTENVSRSEGWGREEILAGNNKNRSKVHFISITLAVRCFFASRRVCFDLFLVVNETFFAFSGFFPLRVSLSTWCSALQCKRPRKSFDVRFFIFLFFTFSLCTDGASALNWGTQNMQLTSQSNFNYTSTCKTWQRVTLQSV